MFGFYKLAAAVPELRIADVAFNSDEIIRLYRRASRRGACMVVFPELSLTSGSCGDLFFQRRLQDAAAAAAVKLAEVTSGCRAIMIFGLPLVAGDALYDCAAVAKDGKLLGIVPRGIFSGGRDLVSDRQFASEIPADLTEVRLGGVPVPFGRDLVFHSDDDEFVFGIEIGEEPRGLLDPGAALALAGANLLVNPASEIESAGEAVRRREEFAQYAGRCCCAFIRAAAGVHESTSDAVCSGHSLIACAGMPVLENTRFQRESQLLYRDVDLDAVAAARLRGAFGRGSETPVRRFRRLLLGSVHGSSGLKDAAIEPQPFMPPQESRRSFCDDILAIQSAALAGRVERSGCRKLVIGISGGLDSTLALLVALESCRLLKRPASDVLAVTMPGFGTSGGTYRNSVELCRVLKVDFREIPIRKACMTHFEDIGHDPDLCDSTYENVQARERTQILMDLANKYGGMVIGTGDLSEAALGWCTYNGDHMSMYSVNSSLPKTVVRLMVGEIAARRGGELGRLLRAVADTPVSPELLPADSAGGIVQRTEDIIGSYELHDFFLYHFLKYGAAPDKLKFLAAAAFEGRFSPDEIDRVLGIFVRRFFSQQFKRNCAPDSPRIGSPGLAARGDWSMPSDACGKLWCI